MTLTRDSMVWFLVLAGSVIGYLVSAKTPPTQWSYNEWLQAVSALIAILSTKLQGSPLPLSYAGAQKMARGEYSRDIPPPPEAKRMKEARDDARVKLDDEDNA